MQAVSSASRQMSWQKPRERVTLLADLAIRKETVSRKLAELRELHAVDGKPLAQEKAAARTGVSMRQWQRWEAGESAPYARNLDAIAEAFGFEVSEFYESERPELRVLTGDGDKLDRILAELQRANEDRVSLREQIEVQNGLLEDLRREMDALQAMQALLPDFLRAQVAEARRAQRDTGT